MHGSRHPREINNRPAGIVICPGSFGRAGVSDGGHGQFHEYHAYGFGGVEGGAGIVVPRIGLTEVVLVEFVEICGG
jgi:hypothetical protein